MKTNVRMQCCRKGPCTAELPEIYCEKLMILRREIPHFIDLMEALDNPLMFYLISPPKRVEDDPAFDRGSIYIFLEPGKHKYDPYSLVQGALHMASGYTTLQDQIAYFKNEIDTSRLVEKFREANCPVCSEDDNEKTSWTLKGSDFFGKVLRPQVKSK